MNKETQNQWNEVYQILFRQCQDGWQLFRETKITCVPLA